MGKIKKPQNVKLIIGVFSNQKPLFNEIKSILIKRFGPVDFESELLPLNKTNYYEQEMGSGLLRKTYSFKRLIKPERLPGVKIYTNKLENKFSQEKRRRANIDPGYLTLGKVILATTKNQQHRIYLKKGIYAEVALRYKNKDYRTWEWTYSDYASEEQREVFKKIRTIYKDQIE
jgi:hypothetical protein